MSEVFGKIVLERKSQWLNRLRGYKVIISGTVQGTIGNGKTEEFELPAGENTISCKVGWCGSNPLVVKVNPGEKLFLKVSSGMKYFWAVYILVLLMLIARFFIRTMPELGAQLNIISICVFLPAAFYYLYYITIGRKGYLKIEEDVHNIFAK